jgi:type IV pilus assembly protein PilV
VKQPAAGSVFRTAATGFTLVEVLVALVVLSVGMLGIAALYLDSLRASRAALYRTQAVNLASDMADRIRTNRGLAGAYNCDGLCEAGEGGNAVAIADINAWLANAATNLTEPTCSLTYTAGGANTPDVYDVVLTWVDVGYDDPLTYQLRVEI